MQTIAAANRGVIGVSSAPAVIVMTLKEERFLVP